MSENEESPPAFSWGDIKVPKSFTIDRGTWARGDGHVLKGTDVATRLRNVKTGKQCCIGFLAEACGVPKELTSGRATVLEVRTHLCAQEHRRAQARGVLATNTVTTSVDDDSLAGIPSWVIRKAYRINDSESIAEHTREEQIREVLAPYIEVVFVGEPEP